MKISYDWLKQYIDFGLSPKEIGDTLTECGLEVENIEPFENDFIFEIGLTPNRGDANSHIGVARDLYAALNISGRQNVNFTKPDISTFQPDNTNLVIPVEVLDQQACPRYCAVTISDVTIKESPAWIKNKLKALGITPINNVVDVTNYILHEYGQPLHAFDADKIGGGKVIIRHEPEGTTFKKLDGGEIKLTASDLVICDEKKGMCIAGVYGGYESGIRESTRNIFIESAYFNPASIRKTSTYHNLRTEAATHFEKGCDLNGTADALKRAALLIKKIAGGNISSELIDIYPAPITGYHLNISYDRITQIAGITIKKDTIKKILAYLEIQIEKQTEDGMDILVPVFKTDVTREADIIEEILRIYGYNNIGLAKNLSADHLSPIDYNHYLFRQFEAGKVLSANGFHEIICNSLTNFSKWEDHFDPQRNVDVSNSKTELTTLRRSLLLSGLEVISHNLNHKYPNLKLFEFGKIYSKENDIYNEQKMLSFFITGNITEKSWQPGNEPANIFHLLSVIKKIFTGFNIEYVKKEVKNNMFSYCLSLTGNNQIPLGIVGLLNHEVVGRFDIKKEVFYAELKWDQILSSARNKNPYEEIIRFPEVQRDLSFIIDKNIPYERFEELLKKNSFPLLKKVNVSDFFEGKSLGKGKKSYSISFTLQSKEKTLTDNEIENVMKKLTHLFESELDAIVRK